MTLKVHYALFCKTRASFGAHCEIVIKIALYLDPQPPTLAAAPNFFHFSRILAVNFSA